MKEKSNKRVYGIFGHESERFMSPPLENVSRTIRANRSCAGVMFENNDEYLLRFYTEREVWRLMDFDDRDFDKAKAAGLSKTRLYAAGGDSICVGVLEHIFRQML
jgi:DNA (cytosine-5)-methyltransferase 1